MGNFIWHDWARFVAIAASVYLVWAGYWGIFYRKFFWDFVDGTLRDPGGLQPGPSALPFVAVIVKVPIFQIAVIFSAISTLIVEFPAPFVKGTSIHRSWVVRIIMLLSQALLGLFVYQATNGALYSIIAAIGYTMAQVKGEQMAEATANRGKGDGA